MTRAATAVAVILATAAIAAGTAVATAAEAGNRLACIVHDAPEAGRLATCTGQVAPRKPVWQFILVGEPPNHITRIEIFESGKEQPRQVLNGLDVRPALVPGDTRDPGKVAIVLQDVNFDRHADLRIALGPPDAEGTAYRWFLFDREADLFAPTSALDRLRDPVFNPSRRLVLGAFRDERGRTGQIAFKWRDGALAPVGARARAVDENGRCILSHYVVRDGAFVKLRETPCRESSAAED